ncbi:MAG: hypothetical protein U0324_13905 [Polyangiales bacterium]
MAKSNRKPTPKRKPAHKPAHKPAPELAALARPSTTDLLEGVGPVRWGDTEARLTREQGLTRSSMSGWRLLPRPWVTSSGDPLVIELKFHAGSGRIEALRATWYGDEEGAFDAWFTGEAPRRFETLLASMGCALTGHQRFQCDPAKAGEVATLGEGDGDVYRGPGDVAVHTWLNFDPPEFVLSFEPPAPSLDDATVARAIAVAAAAARAAEPSPDPLVEDALARFAGPPDATWGAAAEAMAERARLDATASCALARAVGEALALRVTRDPGRRAAGLDATRDAIRTVFIRCGESYDEADARSRTLLPMV